jgi:hypothetical protein
MIYKDKGCNHMWACPCGFHWCWQCGGPYHGTSEQTVDGKRVRMDSHHDSFNCQVPPPPPPPDARRRRVYHGGDRGEEGPC